MNAMDYWDLINPQEQADSAAIRNRYQQEQSLMDAVRQRRQDIENAPGYWSQNPELKTRELAQYAENAKAYGPGAASSSTPTDWVPDHKLNTFSNWAGTKGQPDIGYRQHGKDNPRAKGDDWNDYVNGPSRVGPWNSPDAYGEDPISSRHALRALANKFNTFGEIVPQLPPTGERPTPGPYAPPYSGPEMQNYEHGTMSPYETPTESMGDFLETLGRTGYNQLPKYPGLESLDPRSVSILLNRLRRRTVPRM
jgi:hypothetical protein